jgi:hypothetical protein
MAAEAAAVEEEVTEATGNVAEDDADWSVECRRSTDAAAAAGLDADKIPMRSCLRMDDGVADPDEDKDKDCSESDDEERRRRVAAG